MNYFEIQIFEIHLTTLLGRQWCHWSADDRRWVPVSGQMESRELRSSFCVYMAVSLLLLS